MRDKNQGFKVLEWPQLVDKTKGAKKLPPLLPPILWTGAATPGRDPDSLLNLKWKFGIAIACTIKDSETKDSEMLGIVMKSWSLHLIAGVEIYSEPGQPSFQQDWKRFIQILNISEAAEPYHPKHLLLTESRSYWSELKNNITVWFYRGWVQTW